MRSLSAKSRMEPSSDKEIKVLTLEVEICRFYIRFADLGKTRKKRIT